MKTELKKDEKIILESKPHGITLVGPFIFGLILTALGIMLGGYGFILSLIAILTYIYLVVARNNNTITVTTLRIVKESGVFSSSSKESPIDKINNITYNQTFTGKIWGYGVVEIQTAATQGDTWETQVKNPKLLKDTITEMQEQYKSSQMQRQAEEIAKAIAAGQQNNNKSDVAYELEKLYELKVKGILTDEEFSIRKAKILAT